MKTEQEIQKMLKSAKNDLSIAEITNTFGPELAIARSKVALLEEILEIKQNGSNSKSHKHQET